MEPRTPLISVPCCRFVTDEYGLQIRFRGVGMRPIRDARLRASAGCPGSGQFLGNRLLNLRPLDAALVAEPIADAPFEKTFGFDEELVIVAAANHPPIGKKGSLPRSIIVFEHGCPHRKRLEDWYASRREMPERTIELASYHAMLGCVVAGMGIALIPKSVLATFPERKRLSIHLLARMENRAQTVLICRKGAGSANVKALQEILQGRKFASSSKIRITGMEI